MDEAARRRFVKRIYIPLPDPAGRKQLLMTLMKTSLHNLGKEDLGKFKINRKRGRRGAEDGKGEGERIRKGNERSDTTDTSVTVFFVIFILLWESEWPKIASHFS